LHTQAIWVGPKLRQQALGTSLSTVDERAHETSG
jgi:hypothetical protein